MSRRDGRETETKTDGTQLRGLEGRKTGYRGARDGRTETPSENLGRESRKSGRGKDKSNA